MADTGNKAGQVLAVLAGTDEPKTSKQIAAQAGLETKEVSSVITALKKDGLVHSPVRCKYAATDQGKAKAS